MKIKSNKQRGDTAAEIFVIFIFIAFFVMLVPYVMTRHYKYPTFLSDVPSRVTSEEFNGSKYKYRIETKPADSGTYKFNFYSDVDLFNVGDTIVVSTNGFEIK